MSRTNHVRKTTVYLTVVGALAFALAGAARAQTPVDAFVAKVTEGIAGIHAQAGGDAAKTVAGCSDFLGGVLNLPAMAKTAARDGWEQMTAEQHDAYEKAFAQKLATECARELAKYNGEPITLAGVRNMGGDKLATVRLGTPEKARMIAWQLRGTGDTVSGVDVLFEGHSVMIKAYGDFRAALRANRGNFDAVIESLRKGSAPSNDGTARNRRATVRRPRRSRSPARAAHSTTARLWRSSRSISRLRPAIASPSSGRAAPARAASSTS